MRFSVLYLCLLNFHLSVDSARILCYFPTPSYSHQIVFRAYTRELAKLGNELVIVTPDPVRDNHDNVTEIDISFSYKIWKDLGKWLKPDNNWWHALEGYYYVITNYSKAQLSLEAFQNVLKNPNEKFDLIVVEGLNYPSTMLLRRIYNAPLIGITSMDLSSNLHKFVGNAPQIFMYPDSHLSRNLQARTFLEKIDEILLHLGFSYFYYWKYLPEQEQFVKEQFGMSLYDMFDAGMNFDLMLVYGSPLLGFSRPVLPTHIDISGIHVEPIKPLPKDIEEYLDGANEGVILLSFGTNVVVETIPLTIQRNILSQLSKLPYKIIWKRPLNSTLTIPENVKILPWIPQSDLLAHPKIKLFIFQGGYQSYIEAVSRKVPMIVVPFFVDQYLNAARIDYLKIGKRLYFKDLDKLSQYITAVLDNPMYRNNVERLSRQFYDTIQTPKDRAIWWTEYVLRHNGTKHLKPVNRQLPWFELIYLDITLIMLIGTTAIIIIGYILVRRMINSLKRLYHLFRSDKTKTE